MRVTTPGCFDMECLEDGRGRTRELKGWCDQWGSEGGEMWWGREARRMIVNHLFSLAPFFPYN